MAEKDNKIGGGEINRVGVRMPPFYPDKPGLWFAQLESQFVLANITVDSTKYHHAMGQLDPIYASEVEDIITAPSAPDKYERLKAELIKRLSASREKKVKQLLTDEELGDRKPSQFLRHLKHLAGPGVPEEFLRTIWTSRLPSSTQSIIASQANTSLDEVAELADRIHDIVTPSPQVAAASTIAPSGSCNMSNEIAELSRQVQMLTSKVDRMSRQKSRSNVPNRSRARSTQRSQSNYRKFPTCWFHHKFGNKANQCVKPCDFSVNDGGSR
ncbi:uncharacterized protein [Epargyreus clarus]|uniref:uncharacterized protein n=1 Tax=Epargyreus clarus TaxID=520877 RepID=UPI003C2B500E